MMAKAAATTADAICLDLEDAVAPAEKPAARAHVVRALHDIDFGQRLRIVRINAIDTPFAYRDVVDVIEAAAHRVDLIMVPKVGATSDLAFVDTLLTQIEASIGVTTPIRLEAQIESASGFVNLSAIARASSRLDALIFGAGDYAASMQMPSSGIGERDEHDADYPGDRWHAPMHGIAAAARANGLRCLDGPYAAYKDAAGLERACRIARALGFDGKQCIHPAQIPIVNEVFTPTDEELRRATAIVDAYDAAIAAGHGAAVHDGRMIDGATLRMARAVVDRRKLIDRR